MKNIRIIILLFAIIGIATVNAQEAAKSAYFLDGYTFRHELNPAFHGERNYVSMPALGNLNIGVNSNVGVNTFLYKLDNDRLTTFMSPTVNSNDFLSKLNKNNLISVNSNITLLSAGFKGFNGFNTVSISTRVDVNANLPKDLFEFMKLGMNGPDTRYNFKNLKFDAAAMAEIAFGHSHSINDKIDVGAKFKILLNAANASAKISNMDIRMNENQWSIKAQGEATISAGSGLYIPTMYESGEEDKNSDKADQIDWGNIDYTSFGLSGFGLAFDLGATYQVLPDLQLSASIIDLGFISMRNAYIGKTPDVDWSFDGFNDIAIDSDAPDYEENKIGTQLDNMWDDLKDCVNFQLDQKGATKTRALHAKINIGAEYQMPFYKNLTAGFLFSSNIAGCMSSYEGRFSGNIKPIKWFDASISYGISNYGSSFGWLLNFHPKGFNFFIGSDYQFFNITPQILPVGHANANLTLGINFTFGKDFKK